MRAADGTHLLYTSLDALDGHGAVRREEFAARGVEGRLRGGAIPTQNAYVLPGPQKRGTQGTRP